MRNQNNPQTRNTLSGGDLSQVWSSAATGGIQSLPSLAKEEEATAGGNLIVGKKHIDFGKVNKIHQHH